MFRKADQIIQMGHPSLRMKSQPVLRSEIESGDVSKLVRIMRERMTEKGGIGLAAPQVNVLKQIFIAHSEYDSSHPDMEEFPYEVIINPKLSFKSPKIFNFWESCLSIQTLWGKTQRHFEVDMEYLDINGKEKRKKLFGFHAALVQHEIDHLHGILFLDRCEKDTIAFEKEFAEYFLEKEQSNVFYPGRSYNLV
eukprot:TRINITY_DN1522_c0_g2_i1.p1 TRINITY_DN1522_c0_g2~~TRINITY_DN1522_c0_g2_i1.p1  ORF type:complete len:202 (-),score=29.89 TRINITY_DN1522_c0_g2_i1:678-1259(-)